jgi:hypothetical protein
MPETLTYQNAACEATVTVAHPAADVLHVAYRVLNRGAEPLYLCNQLLQGEAPASGQLPAPVSSQAAHVQVDATGAQVLQAIVDVSVREGIRVLDIPYLTLLPPGQHYEQTLVLPLPLVPAKVHGARPAPAAAAPLPLRLTLGYFVGSPAFAAQAQEVATSLGTAYRVDDFLSNTQQLLTVGPFQAAVPVANTTAGPDLRPVSAEEWTPWG